MVAEWARPRGCVEDEVEAMGLPEDQEDNIVASHQLFGRQTGWNSGHDLWHGLVINRGERCRCVHGLQWRQELQKVRNQQEILCILTSMRQSGSSSFFSMQSLDGEYCKYPKM